MKNKASKTKFKRLSPGQRIYVRRLKEAARNDLTPYRPPILRRIPATVVETVPKVPVDAKVAPKAAVAKTLKAPGAKAPKAPKAVVAKTPKAPAVKT